MEQKPTNPNIDQAPAEFSFTDSVNRLLADERLRELPEDVQGAAIVDRFIGELVAEGGVVDSDGDHRSAAEVLSDIDFATSNTAPNKGTWQDNLKLLTRNSGLRGAVDTLSNDPRTGQLFGGLAHRLVVNGGEPTMTTVTQVTGYIERTAERSTGHPSATWQHELSKAVLEHAAGEPLQPSRWKSSELLSSDVQLVRGGQQAFEAAAKEARGAGVDNELLARSAEEIKRRAQTGQHIGEVAASIVAAPQNYDHLFR